MRIAYLTQSYPPMIGDAARAVEQLARGMAERGHQILVITASERNDAYRALAPNLTIVRLASLSTAWRVGQKFLVFPRRATLRALREFRPAVIHAHDTFQLAQAGLAYARRVHLPALTTVHQIPLFAAQNKILRALTNLVMWSYAKNILQKFNIIIAPTPVIAEAVENSAGIRPELICYAETNILELYESIYTVLITPSVNVPTGGLP